MYKKLNIQDLKTGMGTVMLYGWALLSLVLSVIFHKNKN